MDYTFVSATILLILILDPFGNIPLFASALKPYDHPFRRKIIIREHLIAFGLLLCFMFVGDDLLRALSLSETSLQIAGGLILFLIAIRMIFPHPDADSPDDVPHEPFVVPLAIPLLAGPSSLATVLLLASQQPKMLNVWIGALAVAVFVSCVILLLASRLANILGARFVTAMERLMGLILVAIAVEMMTRGLKALLG